MPAPVDGAGNVAVLYLDYSDVLGLWAFFAFGNSKLDFLPLCQRLEALRVNCTEMDENVWAAFLLDETETLGFIEPFNSAISS